MVVRAGSCVVFLLLLAGCGNGTAAPLHATPEQLAGVWFLTVTENGECGDDTTPEIVELVVEADPPDWVVGIQQAPEGERRWSARLVSSGSRLLVPPYSYPDDGGTTSTKLSYFAFQSLNSFSGVLAWTWSDGGFTCEGTTNVVGVR